MKLSPVQGEIPAGLKCIALFQQIVIVCVSQASSPSFPLLSASFTPLITRTQGQYATCQAVQSGDC